MTNNPYQVLGVSPPVMRGRASTCKRLLDLVTKANPDHASVVGHKHYGKTVLLKHVVDLLRDDAARYLACAYADLGHKTPRTDAEFRQLVAAQVGWALRGARPELAAVLTASKVCSPDDLTLVFETLAEEDSRVLLMLDGFDAVLTSPDISRNWWDNLRDLASLPSLRIVTGSRAPLQDLCITEGSQTSDFWGVFNPTPIRIGPFAENDWESLLQPLVERGFTVDDGARKELVNWTAGVPLVTAGLLHLLYDQSVSGMHVGKPEVDSAAEQFLEDQRQLLGALWTDCSEDTKKNVIDLATAGEMAANKFSEPARKDLQERGFVKEVGQNRLKLAPRLLTRFAEKQQSSVSALHRLFGSEEDFHTSMPAALKLRLSQNPGIDPTVKSWVEHALNELASSSSTTDGSNALWYFRPIVETALGMIWRAELPNYPALPQEWVAAGVIYEDYPFNDGKYLLPQANRGAQCALLRKIVSSQYGPPLARCVRWHTSILVDIVKSAADLGQHRGEEVPTRGFMVAACMAAVELCDSLQRDLHRADTGS